MALTPAQLEDRRQGIGGSEAAAVVGLHPYKTDFEVWLDKRGEMEGIEEEEESEFMYWGTRLEDTIADAYSEITQRKIRKQPKKVSKKYPWMHINMDRQIVNDPRGPGYLEVKNFGFWSGRTIHSTQDVPDYVQLQVQHGLAVTEYAWGAYAILVGGQRLFKDDVDRDETVIEMLIEAEREFWQMIITGTRPEVGGTKASIELIKRMYPRDSGVVLKTEDPLILKMAKTLVQVKQEEKRVTEEKETLNNWFKLVMKEANELQIKDFGKLLWRSSADKPVTIFDEDRFKAEKPEIYEQYQKEIIKKGTRSFYVSEGEEKPKPKPRAKSKTTKAA